MWLFWIVILVVIVLVVKILFQNSKSTISESPLDILKQRYAQGEIDEEEFHRRQHELEQ